MSDQAPVQPALTVEEWIEFGDSTPFFEMLAAGKRPFGPSRRFTSEQKLHALAALALHRHPSGFTAAEVDAVSSAIDLFERRWAPGDDASTAALRSLRRKLQSLLPPPDLKIPVIE